MRTACQAGAGFGNRLPERRHRPQGGQGEGHQRHRLPLQSVRQASRMGEGGARLGHEGQRMDGERRKRHAEAHPPESGLPHHRPAAGSERAYLTDLSHPGNTGVTPSAYLCRVKKRNKEKAS